MNINTKNLGFVNFNGEEMQWVKFNNVIVYEAWKNLIASGTAPLTLINSGGKKLVDYKIYGESMQQILPSAYQQVEYIETTGTQFINTNFTPTGKLTIKGKINIPKPSSEMAIMGTADYGWELGFSTQENRMFSYLISKGTSCAVTTTNSIYNTMLEFTAINDYDKSFRSLGLNIDNSYAEDTSGVGEEYRQNLYLFSYRGLYLFVGKCYEMKIYNDDVLVRDFIPCYRKSDNVIGMYDLVEDKFYTNSGTGEFLKGNNAPTPETPIEIESVGNVFENEIDYSNLPDKTNGSITYTNNKDGSIIANGTTSSNLSNYVLTNGIDLSTIETGVEYYASSGNDKNEQDLKFYLMVAIKNKITGGVRYSSSHTNNIFKLTDEEELLGVEIRIYVSSGTPTLINHVVFRPVIRKNGYKIPVRVFNKKYNQEKYTIVGTPTITSEGVASNFGDTSYVNTGFKFTPENNTWEYGVKIKTSDTIPYSGVVGCRGSQNGCTPFFLLGGGNWIVYLSSNGTSWDIANGTEITKLSPNTTYWLKAKFTGTQYIFSYSLDGRNWTVAKTIDSTLTIYNGLTVHLGNNRGNNAPFNGEIDLSSFYIKIDNKYAFTGFDIEKEMITNIFLDKPLRKITNYIGTFSDYIDFEKKQVVRNILEFNLDGSQSMYTNATIIEGYDTFGFNNAPLGLLGDTPIFSSKLPGDIWNVSQKYQREQIASATSSCTLRIAQSRGVEFSGAGIKNWLKENPIDVLHILKTPKYEDIELPDIPTLKGTTILEIDTKIQPSNVEVVYKGK